MLPTLTSSGKTNEHVSLALLRGVLCVAIAVFLDRSRASLIEQLEWNGKKRTQEADQLKVAADVVAKEYPEILPSFKRHISLTEERSTSGSEGPPSGGEMADLRVLPSWHFDICLSLLFD